MAQRRKPTATAFRTILPVLLLATVASADGLSYEPQQRRKATLGIYAAEAGGALAGGVVLGFGSFALAGYVLFPSDELTLASAVSLFGVSPLLALTGFAGGTCIVGSAFGQEGKFWPALGYAAGSAALGLGLYAFGQVLAYRGGIRNYNTAHAVGWAVSGIGIGVAAAMPFAAVYGYNRSRPRESLTGRFLPGSIGLRPEMNPDGTTFTSLDVRLVNVEF